MGIVSKKLSIVVAVYNAGDFLKECLNSLLNQDVAVDSYEIICINDGSKDESGEILDEYAKRYKNVCVIHKENGGASSARNVGLDIAKGEYIWFVDADDLIRENCLNAIFQLLDNHHPDSIYINGSWGETAHWGENSKFDYEIVENPKPANGTPYAILKASIIYQNQLRFDTNFIIGEDQLFHISFWLRATGTILRIHNLIYFYRMHEESTIHSVIPDKRVLDSLALAAYFTNESKSIGDKEKKRYLVERARFFVWSALYFLPKTNLNYKDIMREVKREKLSLPFMWGIPEARRSWEWRFKKFLSRLLSIKCVYFMYYKWTKRKLRGKDGQKENKYS